MAVNLATAYSGKINAAFVAGSFLAGKASTRYEFTGVSGLKIYTPTTQALTNYSKTATGNRYGTPAEMQDTVQEVVMSQDKSFALTIDKGNNQDQMNTKEAGRMLKMQIDERVIPTIDTYAISQWVKHAGKITAESSTATSKSNIVERIGVGMAALDDALVPLEGRYIGVSPTAYNYIRLSTEFVGIEALGKKSIEKGVVGELMGGAVVKIPASIMGSTNINFIIWHKSAVLMPQKIKDAKVHQDPPGISGHLLEGRWKYDAFVLGAKSAGVYVSVANATQQAAPTITYTGGVTDTIGIVSSGADSIKYTLDGSDPRHSDTAVLYSSALDTSGWDAGDYTVKAVAYDASNFTSNVTTTVCSVSAT